MPCMSGQPDRFSNRRNRPCEPIAPCPRVSSRRASLEEPAQAVLAPVRAPEPGLEQMPQGPERVHLRQEQAQVQELLQQEQAVLAPERAQPWSTETSLPEIA